MRSIKAIHLLLAGNLFCALLFTPLASGQAPVNQNILRARGGLPHVMQKLQHGRPLTVAYLGGSITAQEDGWRSQTLSWLKIHYPKSAITEVNATVSGTGSTLGAFRLAHDVLAKHPDLLLVEFSVNDGGGKLNQMAMEGIVRQVWQADPDTDIALVYTVSDSLLTRLLKDQTPASTAAAEVVAAHYGIPSINFGLPIADAFRAGNLVMRGPRAQASADNHPQAFSEDGTHPYAESGHKVYTETFSRAFERMESITSTSSRWPRAPIDVGNLEFAKVLSLDQVPHTGDWHPVSLVDPTGTMTRSLPLVMAGSKEGSTITFSFIGNLFGIFGVKGPDAGQFSVQVDNEAPKTTTLRDPYSTAGRYRIRDWFSPLLAPGPHTVKITLVASKAGVDLATPTNIYVGAILINGSLK